MSYLCGFLIPATKPKIFPSQDQADKIAGALERRNRRAALARVRSSWMVTEDPFSERRARMMASLVSRSWKRTMTTSEAVWAGALEVASEVASAAAFRVVSAVVFLGREGSGWAASMSLAVICGPVPSVALMLLLMNSTTFSRQSAPLGICRPRMRRLLRREYCSRRL